MERADHRGAATPPPAAAPKTRRSGTVWTDADYAAHGYGMLRVRIPQSELDALRRLAADWGVHVTAAVRHMIAHAAELPAPNSKKPLSR